MVCAPHSRRPATAPTTQQHTQAPPPSGLTAQLASLRSNADNGIKHYLPEPQASLAVGVLLGGSGNLDADFRLQLQRSGLAHLLAIDGFKQVVVASAIGAPSIWLLGRHLASLPIMLGLVGYTLLTGAHPSAVRAGLMVGLATLAALVGRVADPLTSLLLAVVLMAVVEPRILLDVGLQLSLSAVLGIVLLWPRLRPPPGWPAAESTRGAASAPTRSSNAPPRSTFSTPAQSGVNAAMGLNGHAPARPSFSAPTRSNSDVAARSSSQAAPRSTFDVARRSSNNARTRSSHQAPTGSSFYATAGRSIHAVRSQLVSRSSAASRFLSRMLFGRVSFPRRLARWVVEPAGLTLAVTLATLPVVLNVFQLVSLVSPVAHVFAIPLLPLVLVGAALLALVAPVEPLAHLVSPLAWLPTTLLVEVVQFFGRLPGAALSTGRLPPLAAAGLAAALLTWGLWNLPEAAGVRRRWVDSRARRAVCSTPSLCMLACLTAAGLLAVLKPDGRVHVQSLAAARGEAVLIRGPTGQTILVVGGSPNASLLATQVAAHLPVWEHKLDSVLLLDAAAESKVLLTLARYPADRRLYAEATTTHLDLGGGAGLDVVTPQLEPNIPPATPRRSLHHIQIGPSAPARCDAQPADRPGHRRSRHVASHPEFRPDLTTPAHKTTCQTPPTSKRRQPANAANQQTLPARIYLQRKRDCASCVAAGLWTARIKRGVAPEESAQRGTSGAANGGGGRSAPDPEHVTTNKR